MPRKQIPSTLICLRLLIASCVTMAHLLHAAPASPESISGGSAVFSVIPDSGGVLFVLKNGRMRIEPWTEEIIRVQYTPGEMLPEPATSAVLQNSRKEVQWTIDKENTTTVTVSTPGVHTLVDRATGAVTFQDPSGKVLLAEPAGGGKHMQPVKLQGRSGWSASQVFSSPADESLYGFGGYWHGVLDHKGDMVYFNQSNPCDVSPVMVSSKGYGILWDSAALGEFDACREPVEIPDSAFSQSGNGAPGLKQEYFSDYSLTKLASTGSASRIDFDWNKAGAAITLPEEIKKQSQFSARWSGRLNVSVPGTYLFLLRSCERRARLILDKKLVVENWIEHGNTFDTGHIALSKGEHEIEVEFAGMTAGHPSVQLSWVPPTEPPSDRYSWKSVATQAIDYYFMKAPTVNDAIRHYRLLTGQAPMYPKTAYGYWHCQASCKEKIAIPNSQKNMVSLAEEYRRRNIPVDNIVQDFQYWSKMGQHDFRPDTHPDPVGMIHRLKELHYQVMFSIWCIFDSGKPNHDEMINKGYILNPGNGGKWYDPFNPPPGGQEWYNPWNPNARAAYWRQVRQGLFNPGGVKVDAFWMDSTEGYGSAWNVNEYPLVSSQAVYEGMMQEEPNKRPFILGRSLFPGMQRNGSALWSGDVGVDMFTLRNQIPNGLGVMFTGLPYWTTDIGGFGGGFPSHPVYSYPRNPDDSRYNETFLRWFQYGTFCPIFRIHGATARVAPWEFGPETEKICTDFIRLRYRLMPYIYSLGWKVTHDGYTMMRALPMDFMEDPAVRKITDQFLFGPALLVNPVTELGATSRELYLPKASWIDFWTGKTLDGGRKITAAAPREHLPLLVRAGSILPLGPVMQYVGEKMEDPVELRIYPGADGSFSLYDDDGVSQDYTRGVHSEIPIRWENASRRLTMEARKGSYPGMPEKRTFHIVLVREGHGIGLAETERIDQTVQYDGKNLTLVLSK